MYTGQDKYQGCICVQKTRVEGLERATTLHQSAACFASREVYLGKFFFCLCVYTAANHLSNGKKSSAQTLFPSQWLTGYLREDGKVRDVDTTKVTGRVVKYLYWGVLQAPCDTETVGMVTRGRCLYVRVHVSLAMVPEDHGHVSPGRLSASQSESVS